MYHHNLLLIFPWKMHELFHDSKHQRDIGCCQHPSHQQPKQEDCILNIEIRYTNRKTLVKHFNMEVLRYQNAIHGHSIDGTCYLE